MREPVGLENQALPIAIPQLCTKGVLTRERDTEVTAPTFNPTASSNPFTMNVSNIETSNPFVRGNEVEEPQQTQVKTTPIKNIPLPDNAGPERHFKYVDGGYKLPDPAKKTRSSNKVLLLLDSTLSNALNDTRSLISLAKSTLLKSIAEDPEKISTLHLNASEEDIEAVSKHYDRHGFAAITAEVATAITAWINAYDYSHREISTMPPMIQPYVKAYAKFCTDYGLTFDDVLTNRLITAAGENNVTPGDGQYVVCNTNRVYRDTQGNLVSLRLTTSSSPERRLAGYSANAGFAREAKRILGNSAKAGWDSKKLADIGWQNTKFGVLNIPRYIDADGNAHASVYGLDPNRASVMATVAKDLYNANKSGEGLVDDTMFRLYDPITEEINQITDPDDFTYLFEKYEGTWTQNHTALAFNRMRALASDN